MSLQKAVRISYIEDAKFRTPNGYVNFNELVRIYELMFSRLKIQAAKTIQRWYRRRKYVREYHKAKQQWDVHLF
jgi:hypothetical protein